MGRGRRKRFLGKGDQFHERLYCKTCFVKWACLVATGRRDEAGGEAQVGFKGNGVEVALVTFGEPDVCPLRCRRVL